MNPVDPKEATRQRLKLSKQRRKEIKRQKQSAANKKHYEKNKAKISAKRKEKRVKKKELSERRKMRASPVEEKKRLERKEYHARYYANKKAMLQAEEIKKAAKRENTRNRVAKHRQLKKADTTQTLSPKKTPPKLNKMKKTSKGVFINTWVKGLGIKEK